MTSDLTRFENVFSKPGYLHSYINTYLIFFVFFLQLPQDGWWRNKYSVGLAIYPLHHLHSQDVGQLPADVWDDDG